MASNDNKKTVELSPLKEGVIPVDEWQIPEEDKIVTYSGKCMIMPFNKIIDRVKTDYLNVFYVSYKESYVKQFDRISRYINYFIKFYDDDNELMLNYFYIKFMIDSKKTNPSRKSMIKLIYKYFITDTMYEKVKRFVEDNYRIDLAQNKEPDKQYSESLEFTNKHAIIFMMISTFIKFMIPLVMHYISVIKGKKEVRNLIHYYRPLFYLTYEKEHVNLYAKLFHSIGVKANFNESKNPLIWSKYAANSIDTVSYTEELLDKNLIVDNVFKYDFYENIISFNSTILKTQLDYSCIKNFGINMREISTEKDSDGLSYLDKLEMDTIKIDENQILLSHVNIKDTIKRIKKKLKIKIGKDEREFYIKNMKINQIGKELVFYYYAKIFGGFTDLNHIRLAEYMDLMVLMKRRLAFNGYIYLSQLVSANIIGRVNTRLIHNNRVIDRIKKSKTYQNLVDNKYPMLRNAGKEDLILGILSTLMNTDFLFCDYDEPEKIGQPIYVDYDALAQEFLDFVNQI
jgi:hypothetical protein